MSNRVRVVGVAAAAVTVAVTVAIIAANGANPTVVVDPRQAGGTTAGTSPQPSEAALGADDVQAGGSASTFPTVKSRDLNGGEVVLPDDLPGEATIVLMSWDRDDQDSVDGWILALAGVEAEVPGVDHVQLAVTAGTDVATRSAVTFFMGRAIEDPAGRARTIPLFTDPEVFADLIGIDAPGTTNVLVVVDGEITWRYTGAHDADAEAALRAHLSDDG